MILFHRTLKMVHTMKELDLIEQFVGNLFELLPSGFTPIEANRDGAIDDAIKGVDLQVKVQTPKGVFMLAIEVKNADRIASIREAAFQIKQIVGKQDFIPVVASPYLGERSRTVLKEEGVSYIDLAGNFYLNSKDLYVEKIVEKNPNTVPTQLKNLFSPISSRITRALLIEPTRKWKLGELAQSATVSLGQTSSVIERMISDEFVFWNGEGQLELKDPATLLEAWKKVYPTYNTQKYSFYSFDQEYMAILNKLINIGQQKGLRYALGFFTGADFIAPFIRGKSKVQAYVDSMETMEEFIKTMNLQKVESGGNVEFFIPYDDGVFYWAQRRQIELVGNVPIVSTLQLYMDLFNNPARGEEQAQHLREAVLKW